MPTDSTIISSSTVSASTKNNSTFLGFWYNGTRQSTSSSWSNTTKSDMNGIVAVFGLMFKVAFDANGGTGSMTTKTCYYGVESYQPQGNITANSFTRSGFIFAGWNTKSDGTGVAISNQEAVTSVYSRCEPDTNGTVTLYAQWTSNTYGIVFNGNGSTGGSTASMTRTLGELPFTLTANGFTRAYGVTYNYNGSGQANGSATCSYSFAGWNTKPDESGTNYSDEQSITSNLASIGQTFNLYAKWTAGTVTLPTPTTIPTGKGFDGWYTNSALTTKAGNADASYKATAAITLYAKWGNTKFIVRYNANGGSGTMADQEFTYDYSQNLKANAFTRTGYTFIGWATTSAGAKVYSNCQSVINLSATNNAVVNLYAKWDPITSTTTFNNNGGSGTAPTSVTTTYGSAMPAITTAPTRTGYVFDGFWTAQTGGTKYYNADKSSAKNCDYVAATTLYAHWTAITYSVAFNGNGNTGGSMSTETGFSYGTAKALTANAFTRTGHTFAGWATSASGAVVYANQASVTNLTSTDGATVTLYAKWSPMSYTVTLNKNGGTCSDLTSYTYGVGATLPVATKTGCTFNGWYTNSSYTGNPVTAISTTDTGTKTFYAKFTARVFDLGYDNNFSFQRWADSSSATIQGGGSLTKNITNGSVNFTAEHAHTHTSFGTGANYYNISIQPNTEYTIKFDVAGTSTTYEMYYVLLDADRAIIMNGVNPYWGLGTRVREKTFTTPSNAKYIQFFFDIHGVNETETFSNVKFSNKYRISVSPSEGRKAYTYDGGTYGELISPTRTGYAFVGWFDTWESTGGTQITSSTTQDAYSQMIYSRYIANNYTLRHNKNDGTATKQDKTLTYDVQSRIMWKDSELGWSRTGYTFMGWATSSSGAVVYENGANVINLTSTANAVYNIYAVWQINRYTVTLNAETGKGTVTGAGTYDYGSQVEIKATPASGYSFSQWSDGNTSATRTITIGTSNVVLTAQFAAHPVNVSAISSPSAGGVSSVNGTPGGGSFETGSTALLKATPNAGYDFTRWSDGGAQEHTIVVNGDSSLNVYTATYTIQKCSINLSRAIQDGDTFPSPSTNDCGTVKIDSGTAGNTATLNNVNYGTQHTILATAKTGWEFVRWSDGNTNASRTITLAGSVTLQAIFKRRTYAVTVSVASGTSGQVRAAASMAWGATSTVNVKYEASTVIATNPTSGWQFKKWSDNNTTSPRTINIQTANPAAVTLEAEFERKKFRLTVNVASIDADKFPGKENDKVGKVSIRDGAYDWTATGEFYFEESVLLHTQEVTGWELDHWSEGSGSVSIPDHDITVTAFFRRKRFRLTVATSPITADVFDYDPTTSYYDHASDNTPGVASIDSETAGASVYKDVKYEAEAVVEVDQAQGWAVDHWGDTEYAGDSKTIEVLAVTNLTIHMKRLKYTVSVAAEPAAGGTANIGGASSQLLRYGEQQTIHGVAGTDYAFNGWIDDTERTHYDRIITCKGELTYTATFRYIVHTVNFFRSPNSDYGSIDVIINDVASETKRNPTNGIQVREGQKILVRAVPGRIYDAEQLLCYDGPDRETANIVWAANFDTNSHSFFLNEGYAANFSLVTTFKEKPTYELRVRANPAAYGSVELTSDYGNANFEKWTSIVDGLIRINAYKGITYNASVVYDKNTVDFEGWTDEEGTSEGVTSEKYSFVVAADSAITEKEVRAQLVSRRRQITFANGTGAVAGKVQCFYENGTEINSPCDVLYGQYLRIVAKPEMEYLFNYFRSVNTNVPIGGQTLPTDNIEKDDFLFQVTKAFGMQFSLTAFFTEKDPLYINLSKNVNAYGIIKLRYADNASKNWSETNNVIDLGVSNPAHVGITFIAMAAIVPHTSLAGNEKVRFLGWFIKNTEVKLTDALSYEFSSTTAQAQLAYEARFGDIPLYAVTVTHDGLGTVTVESDYDVNDPNKFLAGRTVTLRATPNAAEGYELSRWYNQTTGAVVPSTTGEKPGELYTISNIDRDMTILAEFKRIKLNHISYGVHPATSTVSAVSSVSYHNYDTNDQNFYWGDTVVMTATLADATNYPFEGFYLDGMKLDITPTVVGNVVTGSFRLTQDYCDIKVKCSARVTVAETHTTGASGGVTVNGSGTTAFVALGDTCTIAATATTGMFNGWYLSTDTQYENVLEYGSSAECRVVGTTSLVARFLTTADFIYIALFNEFMNSSESDSGVVLGDLSMTNGTEITEAQYNQAMFGSSTLVTGAYAYYKFAGACNSQITAEALTQRGFHNWVRKTVTSQGIGPATEFSGANVQNPSVVTNKHYAFYCYWGDAQPVHVYVGFVNGSSSAVGAVRFSADSDITEYDDKHGVAVGYVAQGSKVTVNANVKNGYRFVGWYLEEAGTSQMISEEQEYSFTLSDTICLYAKIAEDANAIYAWDASSNPKDMEWKSKVFVSNKPFDPSVIRVDADGYDRPLTVGVDLYSSPDTNEAPTVRKQVAVHNQTMRRLEASRPERFMQVTIKNNKPVNAVFVGTSSSGITQ